MEVGNGEGWNGDWEGIGTWVRGLYPNLLHDLDTDTDAESEEVWPHQIEVYVGSRTANTPPSVRVDVSELEAEDAASHVTLGIQDVLAAQPEDRSTLVVKITATRQGDEDGTEEPWVEAGNLVRSFTRAVTVRATIPNRIPVAEPWASPSAAPAARPPALDMLAPSPAHHPAVAPMFPPSIASAPAVPFTSPSGAPNLGEQAMLYAFQTMHGMLHMSFAEHRFLVEQNAALTDRLIGVHETAIRTTGAETRAARQSLESMNRDVLNLHRANVESAAEIERVRLEGDKRAGEREAKRVSEENKQLRETLENALIQLNSAKEAAAVVDPNTDPLRAKVAGAADQVLNAVIAGLSGQKNTGGENGTAGAANGNASGKAPEQGDDGGGRRRRRRPVQTLGGAPTPPAPAPTNGGGGAAFNGDLSKVTPMQAAVVLKMLTPEVRRATLRQLVGLDRDLAIQLGVEAADAVDAHDGVAVEDDE